MKIMVHQLRDYGRPNFLTIWETALKTWKKNNEKQNKKTNKTKTITTRTSSHSGKITSPRPEKKNLYYPSKSNSKVKQKLKSIL